MELARHPGAQNVSCRGPEWIQNSKIGRLQKQKHYVGASISLNIEFVIHENDSRHLHAVHEYKDKMRMCHSVMQPSHHTISKLCPPTECFVCDS